MNLPDELYTIGIAIPASLETVDAALMAYLLELLGENTRQRRQLQPVTGLIGYQLIDESGWTRLGQIGEIWMRQIGEARTNLRAVLPKAPSDEEVLFYAAGWFYQQDRYTRGIQEAEKTIVELIYKQHVLHQNAEFEGPGKNTREYRLQKSGIDLVERKKSRQRQLLETIMQRMAHDGLLQLISPTAPAPQPDQSKPQLPGGKPLTQDEKVWRLAMASWATELRESSGEAGEKKLWKQIAHEIGWPHSVKLLEKARADLVEAQRKNDTALLDEVLAVKQELQRNQIV
jgi:hypothetical protein